MSSDRELLEFAAKAAGLKLYEFGGRFYLHYVDERDACMDWNPLVNDGDALRLAVKLGLDVFCRPSQWSECGRIGKQGFREKHGADPYAATRRAIVRAAAEIERPSNTS